MYINRHPNRIVRVNPRGRRLTSDNRGNILVYLIVVILIFGVLGVSLVSLFTTATGSSATPNDAKRARFIAESGIRYALSEIRNSPDLETAAELLNTTAEFKLGKDGSFTADVFSPGLKSLENKTIFASGTLNLDVPYSGDFPDDFAVHNAVNDVYIVDWLLFKGTTPPPDSFAMVTASPNPGGASDVTLDVGDNYDADLGDTVCFAFLVTDAGTNLPRGSSIYVNEKAAEFFPEQNGAIRILTVSDGNQYDYYYETRQPPSGSKVELKNVREMPGDTWSNIANLQPNDYVILSPYNFRVFASGTSDQTTVEVGNNRPFWALARPSEYTIYMRELLKDKSVVQEGNVIRTQEAGDRKIELGKGTSGTEGFGDLWYGGEKPIGGDNNFCNQGRCIFDLGVRVFFTADVIPGANDGQGFTFAIIAGGTFFTPVNTRLSGGGDFQLPELLAYGGAGLKSDGTFLDTNEEGLRPPKMALEFDTKTNLDQPLAYCLNINDLKTGSRNDPQPGGTDKDVLQYVFWGTDAGTDLDIACRDAALSSKAKASYDDNRHDAEGEQVAENFAFPVGAPIRSEPTYDPTDGTVYFGSNYNGAGDFWAVDTNDGQLKWLYNAANRNITSKPALDTIGAERFVYFSAVDDLYKLEAATGVTGTNGWIRNVGNFEQKVSPVVDNNTHKIYIGSKNERFYEYNSDGVQEWARDLNEDVEATAALDKTGGGFNGRVYQGTSDDNSGTDTGQVFGFDPGGATPSVPLWNFLTDQDIESRPAINADGTVVYAVTDIGKVYAIPTATGGPEIWLRDIESVNLLDIAVWVSGAGADGTVYVPTDGGKLYAFNPINGNNRPGWPINLAGGITFSSPAVGPDGTIYIGSNDNRVHAINPDGTIKWEYPIPGGFDVRSTPEIGADGVVYVGADDGNLYALANVALPRNYRNSYVTGQQGHLTFADLDSTVSVDDPDNWLDGELTKGPWAVRTEIERATSVNASGNYEYTLRTWLRQCAESDCSDIKDTPFQDTTGKYDFLPGPPVPDLPLEQVIELTPAEHGDFERFLFGFTTAASATDTQTVEIRDFQLTFSQSGDPTIIADPTWLP